MIRLLYVFILSTFVGSAQTTFVSYKMERILPNNRSLNKDELAVLDNTNAILQNISFELYYNSNLALFQMNDYLISEEQKHTYTAYIPSKENIYIKNGKRYTINSDFVAKPNSFLIEEEMPRWQLLNETKIINGLTCFKAISSYSTRPNNSFPIIAWYCPSLNSNFGPNGIGGLPGTILVLQYGFDVYTAVKIKQNTNETLSFPDIKKIISYSEYLKLLDIKEQELFLE